VGEVLIGLGLAALVGLLFVTRLLEMTFIRLGRARARGLDEADWTAGRLGPLLADREVVLGPLGVIRMTCIVTVLSVVAIMAANRLSVGGVMLSMFAVVLTLYLITEAVPRRIALESNDQTARAAASGVSRLVSIAPLQWLVRPFHLVSRFLGPSGRVAESSEVAEDELVAMAEAAAAAQLIEGDEAELIGSVFELGDTIAREVMVPRPDMVTVGVDLSVRAALQVSLESGYSRVPVVGESADDVVGLVLSKDLMSAVLADGGAIEPLLRSLLRNVAYVPETKRVTELMREMQSTKRHLAIVVDEYGGTAGLVALEDIIEEMVGEIVDEHDDESALVEELENGELLVSGRLPIDDLMDLLHGTFPLGDWDTAAGLVFDLLGHVPEVGETVAVDGFDFVAEKVEGRRIDVVRIRSTQRTGSK